MKPGDEIICIKKESWQTLDGKIDNALSPGYKEHVTITKMIFDGEDTWLQLKEYPVGLNGEIQRFLSTNFIKPIEEFAHDVLEKINQSIYKFNTPKKEQYDFNLNIYHHQVK